jgi:hypothetical protein
LNELGFSRGWIETHPRRKTARVHGPQKGAHVPVVDPDLQREAHSVTSTRHRVKHRVSDEPLRAWAPYFTAPPVMPAMKRSRKKL